MPSMTERSPRISVVLPQKVMDALGVRADRTGETRSQIVQTAVAKHLGVETQPLREGGFANMTPDEHKLAASLGGKSKSSSRKKPTVRRARKRRKS